MWKGNPVLTTVLFGLPSGFLILICYTIHCADILDADEDDADDGLFTKNTFFYTLQWCLFDDYIDSPFLQFYHFAQILGMRKRNKSTSNRILVNDNLLMIILDIF